MTITSGPNALFDYRPSSVSLEIEAARLRDGMAFYKKYGPALSERQCPTCDAAESTALEDYAGSFPVVRCNTCTLVYVPLAPTEQMLSDFYSNAESTKLLNSFYEKRGSASDRVLAARLALIESRVKSMGKEFVRILEIGCGSGNLLAHLQTQLSKVGIECELNGIEPNADLAKLADQRGIEVTNDFIGSSQMPFGGEYDVVLLFELIEHLVNPREVLEALTRSLSLSGLVILSTPNIEGLENIATGYNGTRLLAHAICPPAHLQGYSRVSIAALALLSGLSILSLEAKGAFDAAAVEFYLQNGYLAEEFVKAFAGLSLYLTHDQTLHDPVVPELQHLVNLLQGSSSMTAVFQRRRD